MSERTAYSGTLADIRHRIAEAAARSGREADEVTLLAVSKTFPASAIRALSEAGQRVFAESYAQEATAKQAELADLDLEWHFIGPLQSNKARPVAERFSWVHSVDRAKIARTLNRHREGQPPLNVCLQVNVSGEESKSGCRPEEIPELVGVTLQECPNLRLRGLMAIPAPGAQAEASRPAFRQLARLADELRGGFPEAAWDTLSMGMSRDFEVAVKEGATHVRVGSALFGARSYT
ncbi:YggS family pyridoxal phosphate-dependent enzyme [Thiohalorhabdus methylotrophus]|uniref:Pyridoxal phosphate homeostasis protein n=1 Tax=Thiohalorhabdus methylotrophus TaxID=3242694 RepID=A0ABV4TW17_9GAMM